MMSETKRIVNQLEARKYLGVSRTLFLRMQERGLIPPPLPGTKRYDLKAIDHALDKISGFVAGEPLPAYEDPAISYEKFKASQIG